MFLGPFTIEVDNEATLVNFSDLTEEEQQQLCSDIPYNPETHDVFRFTVTPKFDFVIDETDSPGKVSWKKKRVSYSKVTHVMVHTEAHSPAIVFLGHHPRTTFVGGIDAWDIEGESILELDLKVLKLSVKGKLKKEISRKRSSFSIYASRNKSFAQWVFTKEWISTGNPFRLQYLCVVPRDLDKAMRIIRCDVAANDNGRLLEAAQNKLVRIPTPVP